MGACVSKKRGAPPSKRSHQSQVHLVSGPLGVNSGAPQTPAEAAARPARNAEAATQVNGSHAAISAAVALLKHAEANEKAACAAAAAAAVGIGSQEEPAGLLNGDAAATVQPTAKQRAAAASASKRVALESAGAGKRSGGPTAKKAAVVREEGEEVDAKAPPPVKASDGEAEVGEAAAEQQQVREFAFDTALSGSEQGQIQAAEGTAAAANAKGNNSGAFPHQEHQAVSAAAAAASAAAAVAAATGASAVAAAGSNSDEGGPFGEAATAAATRAAQVVKEEEEEEAGEAGGTAGPPEDCHATAGVSVVAAATAASTDATAAAETKVGAEAGSAEVEAREEHVGGSSSVGGGGIQPRPDSVTALAAAARPPTLAEAGPEYLSCIDDLEDEGAPFIPPPSALTLSARPGSTDSLGGRGWRPSSRRAVVVASSTWNGRGDRLQATVPHANALCEVLMDSAGFPPEEIVFLHDSHPEPALQPTAANTAAALRWLLSGAAPGSSLVFAFVGAALAGSEEWSPETVTNSLAAYRAVDQKSNLCMDLSAALEEQSLPRACRLHFVVDTVGAVAPVELQHSAEARLDLSTAWAGQAVDDSEEDTDEDADEDADKAQQQQQEGDGGGIDVPAPISQNGGGTAFLTPASSLGGLGSSSIGASPIRGPSSSGGPAEGSTAAAAANEEEPSAEVVLLVAAQGALVVSGSETSPQAPSVGALAFAFTQALQQRHTGSYAAFVRAMRYALKNGPRHMSHASPELRSNSAFNLQRPFVL